MAQVYFVFIKQTIVRVLVLGNVTIHVNHFWLGAITCALISLTFCCLALHVELGTLLWLILMASCFLGAFISAKQSQKRKCTNAIKVSALLINETS